MAVFINFIVYPPINMLLYVLILAVIYMAPFKAMGYGYQILYDSGL